MKIIVPMAGLGSRFSITGGYHDPKPLIQFLGKPMIQHVLEHLGLQEHQHIFLCQTQHIINYDLEGILGRIVKDFRIVPVNGLTDGAATTVSLAAAEVKLDDEVMIVNSDQLVYWDKDISDLTAAGTIYCFKGTGPKWSYAKINDKGFVTQVAEKREISEHPTVGMYYWKRFGDYMDAYHAMVAADDRTNNEFYVAPVYNYAVHRGITIKHVEGVEQVGTPDELEAYLVRQSAINTHT